MRWDAIPRNALRCNCEASGQSFSMKPKLLGTPTIRINNLLFWNSLIPECWSAIAKLPVELQHVTCAAWKAHHVIFNSIILNSWTRNAQKCNRKASDTLNVHHWTYIAFVWTLKLSRKASSLPWGNIDHFSRIAHHPLISGTQCSHEILSMNVSVSGMASLDCLHWKVTSGSANQKGPQMPLWHLPTPI